METPNVLHAALRVTVIGHSYRVEFVPPPNQVEAVRLAPREVESAPKMAKYLERIGATPSDARARIKQLQEERAISIPVELTFGMKIEQS